VRVIARIADEVLEDAHELVRIAERAGRAGAGDDLRAQAGPRHLACAQGPPRGVDGWSPSCAIPITSAACGATLASRARSAPRSRATGPTSCRRTSASPAATSSARDGVHRAWLATRARGRRAERLAIAANPHHRYLLA
jgi:hypothetical protein